MDEAFVLLSSPTDIDLEVFTYWVDGKAVDDAFGVYIDDLRKGDAPIGVEFRRKRGNFVMDQSELIKYEIVDQYRTFQSLEHFLCQPSLMQNQSLCIITAALQQSLIDKYWQLDNAFVREVLNRRLTKSRKDLEDISENTGINLRSVTRQFDNIKRVYNAFDEGSNQEEKNIYSFISNVFQLTPALARKYASVVFLLLNKFNMATKRRLRDLPCENLEHCAALVTVFLNLDIRNFYNYLLADGTTELSIVDSGNLLNVWIFVYKAFPVVESVEMDKQLLLNLRDIRTLLGGDILDGGCNILRKKIGSKITKKLDGSPLSTHKVRSLVKALILIAANLSQSREFRDLFEDLQAKIAEPMEEAGLTPSEINTFLCNCYHIVYAAPDEFARGRGQVYSAGRAYSMEGSANASTRSDGSSFTSTSKASRYESLRKDWLRFIAFCRLCIAQLIDRS